MNPHADHTNIKPNLLSSFLLRCAGTHSHNPNLGLATNRPKYMAIGFSILATTAAAFFSSGYALHISYRQWLYTLPFAFGVAALNFIIHRFLVSVNGVGDGRSTITSKEIMGVLPTYTFAILLGLMASAPIEICFFKKEIRTYLKNKSIEPIKPRLSSEWSLLDSIRNEKKHQLDALEAEKKRLENEVMKETNDVMCGPKCIKAKEQLSRFLNERYSPALAELKQIDDESQRLTNEKNKPSEEVYQFTLEKYDFKDRLLALDHLMDDKSNSMFDEKSYTLLWFIRLMFVVFYAGPISLSLTLVSKRSTTSDPF
jgi:hypothetical protein